MTAIVFPSSPSTNQIFTSGNTTWVFDGVSWNSLAPSPSLAFLQGTLDAGNAAATTGGVTSTSTISYGLPSPIGNAGAVIGSNGNTWVINPPLSTVTSLGVGTPASGTIGEIRATNNVTAFYSSDKQFKENIKSIDNAIEKVQAIGGKTFNWTQDYISSHGGADGYFVQKEDFGVIAQDVESVFPLAVRQREDNTLAVDYAKLIALAFQAIIELKTELDSLKIKSI